MADLDKVHKNLSKEFSKVYEQICEDAFSTPDLVHNMQKPLKSHIKKYGEAPILITQEAARTIERFEIGPLFRSTIDWNNILTNIQKYSRQLGGKPRGKDLAIRAIKEKLYELQNQISDTNNLKKDLNYKYVEQIYQADFEDIIRKEQRHYRDFPHEVMIDKLDRINEVLPSKIDNFAMQLSKSSNPKRLRIIKRGEKVGLNTILLGIHED